MFSDWFNNYENIYVYPSADVIYTEDIEKEYRVDIKGTKLYKLICVNEKDIMLPINLYVRVRHININGELKREGIQELFEESLFKDKVDNGTRRIKLDDILIRLIWIHYNRTMIEKNCLIHMLVDSDYEECYGSIELYMEFNIERDDNRFIRNLKKKIMNKI